MALKMHVYQKIEIKEIRLVDYYGFMNKLHQGEIDQKEFQTYGLQSTKNLVKYDVWDEVYSYYDRK